MDNLCHTLVGAACGEAGLKARTRWGSPVLMIAANLPDVDGVAIFSGMPGVALRRGITHGVLAQALLPILLTVLVLLIDRLRPPGTGRPHARAGPLLLLSYLGVLSHVGLDWLNTYGIRLLMPYSGRWFYGDSVFIVDPWLWLVLALGVAAARRPARPIAAAAALAVAAAYIAAMVVSARMAREIVLDAWIRDHGRPPAALMVGPAFLNPLRRSIIADAGDHYRTGTFEWATRAVAFDARIVPRNEHHPAAAKARENRRVRAILVWARFPFYEVAAVAAGTQVTLQDMRFRSRVGSLTVVVSSE